MTKLIDADALLENLDKLVRFTDIDSEEDVRSIINNAPTIQREGWKLVPIEPTDEMLKAVMGEQGETGSLDDWKLFGYAEDAIAEYKAMLAAAPTETE